MLDVTNKYVVKAISPSCYALVWWLAVFISVISTYIRAVPALQASAWRITHVKDTLQLVTMFMWTTSMCKRGAFWIEPCALVWCVQSHCKLYWKPWQFAVFSFSHFPGLVLHDTIYSLLRNSHVFPKAPHLETDAQLLPGSCCVPVGVRVFHPWGSRDMSRSLSAGGQLCPIHTPITVCLGRLRLAVGASDRLSSRAQCCLLPLMHLGWKIILVVIPDAKFQWKEQPQAWKN